MAGLAIAGGPPVRRGSWPAWPQYDDTTVERVAAAIRSGRWAVSWPSTGAPPLERQFAAAFARHNDSRYCVACDHGSSSLVLALEALDVGAGDEVVVPALTWVATATAVLNANAVPVLADVDESGCLSVEAVEAAITSRTAAILTVHLHNVMTDMDGLSRLGAARGIPIVEDCAQSHGARWRGAAAGTIGALGCFSMQQSKVLTAGEGGAVLTGDAGLYDRLQQLRADGRRDRPDSVPGEMDLVEAGDVMGTNLCMSELQAALLLDQLERFDKQQEARNASARHLERRLEGVPGVEAVQPRPQQTQRSIYEMAVRVGPAFAGGIPVARVGEALSAELGLAVGPTDAPLDRNTLFRPMSKRRFGWLTEAQRARMCSQGPYTEAERFHREVVLFHHSALLAGVEAMDDVADAFGKVRANADDLVREQETGHR